MARKQAAPSGNRWRNSIVGEGEEAPDQLLANPLNFRVHTGDQGNALAGALGQVGWIQRVIVNRRTGHVIDGHLRVKLALQRGEATVPVVYVDLDENQERLALATLDPIAAMAGQDDELLAELLGGITTDDPDVAAFLADLAPKAPDATSGPGSGTGGEDDPTTVRGELVKLGPHRLLCGDPELATHRKRLLASHQHEPIRDLVDLAVLALTLDAASPALHVIEPDPATCDRLVAGWETATGQAARRHPPKT